MPRIDEGGFALYTAHYARLTTQIYAYLGDAARAGDIAQKAFVRAFDRWESVSSSGDPFGWVRREAWQLATSPLREAKAILLQRFRRSATQPPGLPEPVKVLAALPAKERLAVVLHHVAQLSPAQIASQQGVAEIEVESWLSRGQARLESHLEETSLADLADWGAWTFQPKTLAQTFSLVRRERRTRLAKRAAILALAVAIPVVYANLPDPGSKPIVAPASSQPSTAPSTAPSEPAVRIVYARVPGARFTDTPPTLSFVDKERGFLTFSDCDGKPAATGCTYQMFATRDSGRTWQAITLPPIPDRAHLDITVLDIHTLVLESPGRGIWVTQDGGVTFTRHSPAMPPPEAWRVAYGPYAMRCDGPRPYRSAIDPSQCSQGFRLMRWGMDLMNGQPPWTTQDTRVAGVGANGRIWVYDVWRVAYSDTRGETWVPLPDLPHTIQAAQVSADGTQIAVDSGGVWYRLAHGGWSRVTRPAGWESNNALLLNDGAWLMSSLAEARFVGDDGMFWPIPELESIRGMWQLVDDTLVVAYRDKDDGRWGFYLGVGAGRDREWTRATYLMS